MSFLSRLRSITWGGLRDLGWTRTTADVERALALASAGRRLQLTDFAALISPAARPFIPQMVHLSTMLTRRRFGRTLSLYIPMYLSNECANICTYCGFSVTNRIPRVTLTLEQIEAQCRAIRGRGFQHVLVLTGESPRNVGLPFLLAALEVIRAYFPQISFEVQPLDEPDYRKLHHAQVSSVLVYQETYNEARYREFHPRGPKSDFAYRLQTPERAARAGMHRIGVGALLGLDDWRAESLAVALHIEYLERQFWKTKYSVSLPRIRRAAGSAVSVERALSQSAAQSTVDAVLGTTSANELISDSELIGLIAAFRLWNENLEISLSTREPPTLRDELLSVGVTSISAESRTDPGGYTSSSTNEERALEQFEVEDTRSVDEIIAVMATQGLDPVWKDWEPSFTAIGRDSLNAAFGSTQLTLNDLPAPP